MAYRDELIQVAAVAFAAIAAHERGTTDLGTIDEPCGMDALNELLFEVRDERLRQESLWGAQTHGPDRWMVILMEEVGEAAEAILEEDFGTAAGFTVPAENTDAEYGDDWLDSADRFLRG